MDTTDSLTDFERSLDATMIPWGEDDDRADTAYLAATFGQYEAEYAAIRSRVAIFHQPQRGLLRFTGADTADFLHRLMTQQINGLPGGATRRAFQLNDKGRIVADVFVHHGDDDTWVELDRVDIGPLREELDRRLFVEDVTIEDISDQRVAIAVLGPSVVDLLKRVTDQADAIDTAFDRAGTHHVADLTGAACTIARRDLGSVPGVTILAPTDHALPLYQALLREAGFDIEEARQLSAAEDPDLAAAIASKRRDSLRGRPVGWLAYNTVRIEEGRPRFHIDFGPDTLPHEIGPAMNEAVRFDKGCYLGQEVVARMQNLGHPAKRLAKLELQGEGVPDTGAAVFAEEGPEPTDAVGAITSAAPSPLRGGSVIALAMLKWGQHTEGTELRVAVDDMVVKAKVV